MSRNPWADYWSGGRAGAGCLPDADKLIGPLLDREWRCFGRELAAKAKVLDLATGDGAVLRKLRAVRPGLDLLGVDLAPVLPKAGAGIKLQGGVSMERLTFRDSSFDAVTSQFGIEYGDVAIAAAQVARILKLGGRLRFVVHHIDSPVLAHNVARRAALAWAARTDYVDKAKRLAAGRSIAALPTPSSFREAIGEARRLHPAQPVAAEFAAAIVQTLDLGRGRPAPETLQALAMLEARAQDEIARIDALEAAARDSEAIEDLRRDLQANAIVVEPARKLDDPEAGRAFAWVIDGRKTATKT